MFKKNLIVTVFLFVLVVLLLKYNDRKDQGTALAHDVRQTYKVYWNYNSTDYVSGSTIDIGSGDVEMTLKVKDGSGNDVTSNLEVFYHTHAASISAFSAYVKVDSNRTSDGLRVYYNNGGTNTVTFAAIAVSTDTLEYLSGSITLN